eukprot:TRINITY_DN2813_c2_g1_i2.p1 TRINITY_DN2813_c2_g1~~TRINITY_DN2813_c2_g1_i2.p1  ORF type:complete len:1578 (+),score=573.80 TRINITY_DN2813_c2_g1_i2:90-4823(+)
MGSPRPRQTAPATIQQERYIQLEKSFAQHQEHFARAAGVPAEVEAGFSLGRRIKLAAGHALDEGAFRAALAAVLRRSPVLRGHFERGAGDGGPLSEPMQPPFSTAYRMVEQPWTAAALDNYLASETVAPSADLTEVCTRWLLRPFDLDGQSPLFRVVLLQQQGRVVEVLLISHRSILDAWSVEWLCQELVHHYEQRLRGSKRIAAELDEPMPPPPHAAEAPDYRRAVAWWASYLSDAMPVLQVPTDRPRPQVPSMKQARCVGAIPGGAVSARLRQLTAGSPQGVHDFFITAFVVWLHRMTFEKDVVIGVLTNLRREGFEASLGPLTNRIPLRVDLGGDAAAASSFKGALGSVSAALASVMRWRHVEFEQVIESARGSLRDSKGREKTTLMGSAMQDQDADAMSPLFKVMYMMESQLTPPLRRDTHWETVSNLAVIGNALAPYDLTLRVNQAWDGGFECVFLYNVQLFTMPFIGELMANFLQLVNSAAENPTAGVYDISLVTPHAREVLPDPCSPQDESWPGSIVDVFHRVAQQQPGELAIEYEGAKRVSYGELDAATSQLAHLLIGKGIRPGDVVGLYGHRSPAVVVAIMALYKAGAAYSMMDPQYPADRVTTCMTIAGISGWIRVGEAPTEPPELSSFLQGRGLKVIMSCPQPYDPAFAELVAGMPPTPPPVHLRPDSTSVITFTSGSTGTPKGVLGRHSALSTFYPWMGRTFEITKADRFGMCSGIAHDPLQRDIFTPLFFGAGIYIPTQATIDTPGQLGLWMRDREISVLCLTPALGQILVTVDDPSFVMPKMRFVKFVGDMLIKRDVLRLRKLAPNCRIINMYGTTETSRAVGYFDIMPESRGGTQAFLDSLKEIVPVGKGMKDAQMLLLNPGGKLAGIGEAAEIYMRSPHIAQGYVALPAESAAKFLRSPFSDNPADRLYRSGDLGHYLADGTVECLGRADDQIKIRGFRIELGEINAKLSRHECCKENVTVVRTDSGEKQIVSYVVPLPGFADFKSPEKLRALSRAMRDFLKTKVPHYMVPSAIVILEEMPLTPNMKINTRALPPPGDSDEGPELDAAGLSPTEGKLLAVWQKHLSAKVRSRDESFFDLGGHSLLATLVTMDVMKLFGIKLPLNVIFANPSLAGMAKAVDEVRAGGAAAGAAALDLLPEAEIPYRRTPSHRDPPARPRACFLTGSSGFLGSFVLRDLLLMTDGPVYCLVWNAEASDSESALKRVETIMRNTQTWRDEWRPRLRPCLGDLATPSFGFSDATWQELVREVDLVVHCGAFVHWLFDYHKLKPANVDSTREAIRLCTEGSLKRLAFVSTTNCYEADYATNPTILETIKWEGLGKYTTETLTGGYTQSKWVADKMVMNAADAGIPASSMRPSYISADTHSGVWGTDDFLVRLMKGCVQLGAFPTIDSAKGIDMTPVDYMSKAIVTLSLDPQGAGRHFNLVNPHPVPYAAVFRFLKESGYPLTELPFAQWRQRLHDAVSAGQDNALAAIIAQFSEGWADGLRTCQVHDCAQVTAGMTGTPFPEVEPTLVGALTYFVACGFIQPPPGGLRRKGPVDWQGLFERSEVSCITRFRAPQKK